jgi:hypothetical protein
MLFAEITNAKDVILKAGQRAPFFGVLVPELTYKEYTLNTEFLPICYEKLNSCYHPEPTFYETYGKPALWLFLGAGAVLLIKR